MSNYDTITNMALEFTDGQENASGIQEEAYFIPLSHMTTVAEPVAGTTAESMVNITTNHIMKADKSPIKMIPQYKKSGGKSDQEGEEGSGIFHQAGTFFIPQINARNVGTAGMLKNTRGIILKRRSGDATGFIQFGSKGLPITLKTAIDLGTGPTGTPGITVTTDGYSIQPFYFYSGVVPVTGV